MVKRPRTFDPGFVHGFRSGLEVAIAEQLREAGVPVEYETVKLRYTKPSTVSTYTVDWELPSGVLVESKGRFTPADRKKHLLVKAQHPTRELRFVFSNSRSRINKGSPTTYADWCTKHGFRFADKRIPAAWLSEKAPTQGTLPR